MESKVSPYEVNGFSSRNGAEQKFLSSIVEAPLPRDCRFHDFLSATRYRNINRGIIMLT